MQSENIGELAAALAKAQAVMQGASKDQTNPHFKSKYADLASIWDACRKPLSDNGLAVVQSPVDAEGGSVGLTTTLLHSSGQWMSSTVSAPLQQNTAQAVGSAITYLRRYALAAMVGVAPDDDDGNAASATPQRPQTARADYVPAPAAADVAEMKSKFVAKFGPWSQHFTLPEPKSREGWIAAGRELDDRIKHASQAPLSDEYAEIDAPNGHVAGVKR